MELLEVLTVVQAALGDTRHQAPPQQMNSNPSIFDGYTSLFADQLTPQLKSGWTRWLMHVADRAKTERYPEVYEETIRTLALLSPKQPEAIEFCLNQIDENSHPTLDIVALCTLAQCQALLLEKSRQATADAFIYFPEKVRTRALTTDNHWGPRLSQLLSRLMVADPNLGLAIVRSPNFGKGVLLAFCGDSPARIST